MRPLGGVPGFSLIEVLVALAVFATMAALAYGGLNAIAHTRTELVRQQDDFRGLMRSISALDRDLREAVSRPVRDNYGVTTPAFKGGAAQLEFTRLGFANPQAEPRANLERVLYELDGNTLQRGTFAVLDRAPSTAPQMVHLRENIDELRLRYLDAQNRWRESWPLADLDNGQSDPNMRLPRAVEIRLQTKQYGEITRTIELNSTWPRQGAGALP